MIAIPNLKLQTTLEALINVIRQDYVNNIAANTETDCWLYRCFNGVVYGNFDYYKQAVEIIVNRNLANVRKLNIRNGFSFVDKPQTPTIYINVPSETQNGVNAIGMNLDTLVYYEDIADDTKFNEGYARTFEGQYELMITSGNFDECELLYRFLQALFIAATDTLNELFNGVFRFSGKQIIPNPDLIPDPMFIRVWVVTIQQTIEVPMLPTAEYLGDAQFEGTMYDDEAIGVAQL